MRRLLQAFAAAGAVLLALLAALTRRDSKTAAQAVAEDRATALAETQARVAEGKAAAQDARQLQAKGQTPEAGVAGRDDAWGQG